MSLQDLIISEDSEEYSKLISFWNENRIKKNIKNLSKTRRPRKSEGKYLSMIIDRLDVIIDLLKTNT